MLANETVKLLLDSFPYLSVVPGLESPGTINGIVPEGTPSGSGWKLIAASVDERRPHGDTENTTIVVRGIREPGTRSYIHAHQYAGTTCVITGTMRALIEGKEPIDAGPGSCYVMPALTKMSAVAVGQTVTSFIDVFTVPCGETVIHAVEPVWPGFENIDDPKELIDRLKAYDFGNCSTHYSFDPDLEDFNARIETGGIAFPPGPLESSFAISTFTFKKGFLLLSQLLFGFAYC